MHFMNEKLEEKMQAQMNVLKQFTEKRVELLFQKTLALEEKQGRCNDILSVIKDKEIERTASLDKLIQDNAENSR